MAGFYADVPAHRMALDKDGTQMYRQDSNSIITQLSSATIREIVSENNESMHSNAMSAGINGQNDYGKLFIVFPEHRDVLAYWFNIGYGFFSSGELDSIEVSSNSTNGVDGNWTFLTPFTYVNQWTSPSYRLDIQTCSKMNVKVIRFSMHSGAPSTGTHPIVHLFGNTSTGQNPNRLVIWHPTLNQQLGAADLDWGDVPRNSRDETNFRVKNISSTLTANSVVVSLDALTDTSPTVQGQHSVSADGVTFDTTVPIGTLAPGAISSQLTLQRITPMNATLSLWALQLLANAATWS